MNAERDETMKGRRVWGPSGTGALLILGALAACSGAHPDLRALRDDPLAHLELPGASLQRRTETAAGKTLGKPNPAQILQTYAIEDRPRAEAVRRTAIEKAEAAGWRITDPDAEPISGRKTVATGDADLSIYLVEENQGLRLVVVLEKRP